MILTKTYNHTALDTLMLMNNEVMSLNRPIVMINGLTTTGDHPIVNGGGANEYDFDFATGKVIEGRITDSTKEYEQYKKGL